MRASGLLRDWNLAVSGEIWQVWQYGAKSILGGLTGAYIGVLIGKRFSGYRGRTGDVFAPAVALGMAIGRIGCLLTEPPGRATALPWGIRLSAEQIAATPGCISCRPGVAMQPSFLYEIAFQLVAFAVLLWLRPRINVPGALFTYYLAGYAAFRFLVEFARDNQVVWVGMTRGQLYLLAVFPLLLWRASVAIRAQLDG
jgi:prolipoprotein diacylglyceryltransferase